MQYRVISRPFVLLVLVSLLLCGGIASQTQSAANEMTAQDAAAFASPSPTPRREEVPQDSDEVIKVETNLTNLFFTAADKNKRFISDLKADDILVLEDGKPQEIFTFQQNIELPLSIAILIDTSISEERTLPDEKVAAQAFLESVMRPNKDEAAVISFTGDTTLEQGFTGSIERLRRAIDRVEFVPPSGYIGGGVVVNGTPPISGTNQSLAGSTAVWDAVWATSEELMSTSAEHTRRAIILLTDGDDTSSRMKIHEAIERAQKSDALIYAIGIGDRYTFNVNEGALRKIAEQTGGRAYFPRHERDLRDAFAQIQKDLREQYLVAYSPTNKARDGSYRKIEIQIVNPALKQQSLKLNYRAGYFAKTTNADPATRKRTGGDQ
jgi:Ca-activated chloride channel homolog